jgi:hypothetical protein
MTHTLGSNRQKKLILKIPVSRVNQKFLYFFEHLSVRTGVDTVILPRHCFLGTLLSAYLVTEERFLASPMFAMADRYEEFVHIEVHELQKNYAYLPDSGIIQFNTAVYRLMHEILLCRILDRLTLGISEKDTIHDFITDMGLSETDISHDGLRQAQQRLRKVKNTGNLRYQNRKLRYGL